MPDKFVPPQRIGFVGLGNMGAPMAVHLIGRGFDVTVFDVRREAAREFVSAHGGKLAIESRAGQGTVARISLPTERKPLMAGA